jgi:bacteriorhodopsin
MFGVDSIFLFFFVFSTLGVLRVSVMFVLSLFNDPPTQLTLSKIEIITFGIFLSYIITYLLK